jgi:hypothetical protein
MVRDLRDRVSKELLLGSQSSSYDYITALVLVSSVSLKSTKYLTP